MQNGTSDQHTRLRNVLLVTYHFPPEPAAACVRPSYIAKYLPEFGWRATVLTRYLGSPDFPFADVVVAKDELEAFVTRRAAKSRDIKLPAIVQYVTNALKNALWFPDRAVGWLPPALSQALAITRHKRFDAIISTSPPPTAHIVACLTAQRRRLPWIADYRDQWHASPYTKKGPLRAWVERGIERWLMRRASAVTAVSDDVIAQQRLTFGITRGETVMNAFDPTEWQRVSTRDPKTFTLCYAGVLYEGKRRLDFVLSAAAALRRAGDPAGLAVRFEIYGPDVRLVRQMAERYGLNDVVKIHGLVDRVVVLQAQRDAAVLLIPLSMDPDTTRELGSKIFECVGAQRPVIAVGPPGSAVKEFISQHGLGWFASDVGACAQAIREAYARFAVGEFDPPHAGTNGIGTARDVARGFAAVLDSIVGAGHESVDRARSAQTGEPTIAAQTAASAGVVKSTGSPLNFSE